MSSVSVLEREPVTTGKALSSLQSNWRRFHHHKLAIAGVIILTLLGLMCATAALWTPYDPNVISGYAAGTDLFAPPGYVNPHNGDVYLLGTDYLGRDVLSRLAYGGQISLSMGLLCALAVSLIGIIIGSLAGYFGGRVDMLLMGLVDLALALPFMQVLLVLSFLLGPHYWTIFIILVMLGWPATARLVRGTFLSLRSNSFVEATRALGASNWRLIARHLLPNAGGPLIIDATINVGVFIIAESSVSFLGFGVSEPVSSWGNMLFWLDAMLKNAPLQIIWPGLLIFLTVISINFIGDALRDALDPRLKM